LLTAAIEGRFRAMLAGGALEEVRGLLALRLPASATAMKAVGVPELAGHLRGESDLETAAAAAEAATRRYAKRQMTWLRGQVVGRKTTLLVIQQQYSESSKSKIFPNIRHFVLTLP
jgi:tRNA dimethylallyltransferase